MKNKLNSIVSRARAIQEQTLEQDKQAIARIQSFIHPEMVNYE